MTAIMKRTFFTIIIITLAFISVRADNVVEYWQNYVTIAGTQGVQVWEDYPMLFDNDASTKWCVANASGTIYVEFDATNAIEPKGYMLTTGDGTQAEPGRNPKSWVIKGRKSTVDDWTVLTTIADGELPAENYASKTFMLSTSTAYRYYRFEVTSLVDGKVFQLSEFKFLMNGISPDVDKNERWTKYVATIGTAGVNSTEDYPKLLDNNTSTKWCVIDFNSSVFIEFDATEAIKPVGYVLTTGNDTQANPDRNPRSWVIKGKNNIDDNWTTLATIENGEMPDKSYASKTFDLNTSTEYRYYRFEVTSLVGGSKFQLSEFYFLVNHDDNDENGDILYLGSNGSGALFEDCPLDSVFIGRKISYSQNSEHNCSPFYCNTSLRSIHISDVDTVVTLNEFYGCVNLRNVYLGDHITKIGDNAFRECRAISKIVCRSVNPPTCGNGALEGINKMSCTLIVPSGSVAAYRSALQWKEFFLIIEEGEDADVIDGIDEMGDDNYATEVDRFDIQGHRIVTLRKGINIIHYSDGTVKKVLIK